MWPAYAVDGNGHDDGDGKYTAQILVAGIGVHFYLGGEARFVRPPFGGNPKDAYRSACARERSSLDSTRAQAHPHQWDEGHARPDCVQRWRRVC